MPRRPSGTPSWRAMPCVEVEWIDSQGDSGWRSFVKERADGPDLRCVTAGYLFEQKRGYIKIAQSLAAANAADNLIAIPRSAIRKITALGPTA